VVKMSEDLDRVKGKSHGSIETVIHDGNRDEVLLLIISRGAEHLQNPAVLARSPPQPAPSYPPAAL
jgi:hypothetical protein